MRSLILFHFGSEHSPSQGPAISLNMNWMYWQDHIYTWVTVPQQAFWHFPNDVCSSLHYIHQLFLFSNSFCFCLWFSNEATSAMKLVRLMVNLLSTSIIYTIFVVCALYRFLIMYLFCREQTIDTSLTYWPPNSGTTLCLAARCCQFALFSSLYCIYCLSFNVVAYWWVLGSIPHMTWHFSFMNNFSMVVSVFGWGPCTLMVTCHGRFSSCVLVFVGFKGAPSITMHWFVRGHSLITQGSRGGSRCKNLYKFLLGGRGSNPFLRNIFQVDILY